MPGMQARSPPGSVYERQLIGISSCTLMFLSLALKINTIFKKKVFGVLSLKILISDVGTVSFFLYFSNVYPATPHPIILSVNTHT